MSAPTFAPVDFADCPQCSSTAALVQLTGRPWTCAGCGDELAPAEPRPAAQDRPQGPAAPSGAAATLQPLPGAGGRPGAPRGPRLVVCPGELAETSAPGALDRAAREAARPAAEDPELVRVRAFVFALRPDAPDPMGPPPVERQETPAPYHRVESAPAWDRLPRGLGSSTPGADPGTERRAHVLGAIASLPPDAAAVCRWLRASATFAQGLRGLYVDVGLAFASEAQREAWENLTARRTGAAAHGRALVLAAERAWREAA